MWAETDELGCGLVHVQDDGDWFKTIVTCNYAVAGNYAGNKLKLIVHYIQAFRFESSTHHHY